MSSVFGLDEFPFIYQALDHGPVCSRPCQVVTYGILAHRMHGSNAQQVLPYILPPSKRGMRDHCDRWVQALRVFYFTPKMDVKLASNRR